MSAVQTEGWYGPPNSRRFHYFREGRSLCGKWLVFADMSDLWDCALGPANGDCSACKKALEKQAAPKGEAPQANQEKD